MNFRQRLERDQSDELLVAKDKKYSAKCLIGNWPSDKLEENEKLKEFLEKRERGELLVQKTTRLYEAFLAPAQVSARATYVSFDQAIQLIACDMPNIHSTADSGPLALSVVVNEPHINRCQEIDQSCDVSCAPSSRPTVRNTFLIRNPPVRQQQQMQMQQRQQCNTNDATNSKITDTADNVSDCQYLKYGQDFMLECYESKQKPLMLYSSPQSPFAGGSSEFVFKAHGEMKQSVGLALQKANFGGENSTDGRRCIENEASIPSKFFHWRFYHINPEMRYETIGENIPINAKVIVQHGFSRSNLCCEKALLSTIFGMECGVSCHTEKNIYGVETNSNVWQISTKSSEF